MHIKSGCAIDKLGLLVVTEQDLVRLGEQKFFKIEADCSYICIDIDMQVDETGVAVAHS